MPIFKDMLKTLTDKFQKTQKPMPPGAERMKKVQEAAKKASEEAKQPG